MILNKSAKATNQTFAGLKIELQGSRIFFVSNPGLELRAWNPPAGLPRYGFHALKSRISYKMYSEPLRYALRSCKGLVVGFRNFI